MQKTFGPTPISTGNLLRDEIRAQTDAGRAAKQLLEAGRASSCKFGCFLTCAELVPDELVVEVLKNHILGHDLVSANYAIILLTVPEVWLDA